MQDEEKVPMEESEEAPLKISRRDFIVGAGAGVIVTGAAAAGYVALRPPKTNEVIKEVEVPVEKEVVKEVEVPGAEVLVQGPGLPANLRAVSLNIDGSSYDLIVDVRESLWETMTKELGLTSANLGCDRAQCGACTVVVDGRAVNGCTVLTARLGRGQEIITVDGLSMAGNLADLHPIQRAYVTEGGHQCAICTRGFVMTTYALLTENPNPTEEEVREALSGNICRCGNYPKIVDSVFKAAEEMRAG